MSREQDNKAIVGRWFEGFWGNPWNPGIIDELAAPDMLLQYSLHAPRRGREDVRNFMEGFRAAFPDLNFWGAADLIAEGDHVVGRWEGGGTHTGPAFSDFLIGSLPAASGRKMRFTGTTVLRVEDKDRGRGRSRRWCYRAPAAWHFESRLTRMSRAGDRPRPDFRRGVSRPTWKPLRSRVAIVHGITHFFGIAGDLASRLSSDSRRYS